MIALQEHDLAGKFMSGEGFTSSGNEGLKAGFYCGDGRVRDEGREDTEFVSHHEVQQRLVGDGVGAMIVCKFGMRDLVCPGTRVGFTEDLKVSLNLLVDTFSFSIRLWVVCSREGEIVVEELIKLLSKSRCELLSCPQNRVKFNSGSLLSHPPTPEHFCPASS